MAIDWSLARGGGNAFAAAMDGYQAGRALAKERGVQNALATYASDPVAGSKELKRFDPKTAMQLDDNRAAQAREATTYAQGQEDRTRKLQEDRLKLAGQMLQGIDTPEKWDAVKGDPQIEALIPGIAASPFEKVNQLRQMGLNLLTKPAEAFTLDNTRFDAQGRVIASVAPEQKYVPVPEGGTLVPIPRGGAPSPAPAAQSPAAGFSNPGAVFSQIAGAPVTVSSGQRTPEHNAEVGGVPNSRHLTGNAADLVPPQGMTTAQLAAKIKASGVRLAEVIDEGDHVHVAWGGAPQGSTPAASIPGAIVGAPKQREQWVSLPDGRQQNTLTGKIEGTVKGAGDTKTTEAERTAGFLASRLADSLKNLTAISGTAPKAGKPGFTEAVLGNALGGEAANATRDADRQQVVANQLDILDAALTLGTGAAYTADQLRNYQYTYFPTLTDKPETVQAKGQKLLALLRAAKIKAGNAAPPELDSAIKGAEQRFGLSSGGAAPAHAAPQPTKTAQAANSPPPAALKAGSVTTFANGQKWTLANGKPVQVK